MPFYVNRFKETVTKTKPEYFRPEFGDKAHKTRLAALQQYEEEVDGDLESAKMDVQHFEEELEKVGRLIKREKNKQKNGKRNKQAN